MCSSLFHLFQPDLCLSKRNMGSWSDGSGILKHTPLSLLTLHYVASFFYWDLSYLTIDRNLYVYLMTSMVCSGSRLLYKFFPSIPYDWLIWTYNDVVLLHVFLAANNYFHSDIISHLNWLFMSLRHPCHLSWLFPLSPFSFTKTNPLLRYNIMNK